MYELEIETKNHIKKIRNPRKVRSIDLIFRVIVQVMDEDGKWHFIGHAFYPSDGEYAILKIYLAIQSEEEYVDINIS